MGRQNRNYKIATARASQDADIKCEINNFTDKNQNESLSNNNNQDDYDFSPPHAKRQHRSPSSRNSTSNSLIQQQQQDDSTVLSDSKNNQRLYSSRPRRSVRDASLAAALALQEQEEAEYNEYIHEKSTLHHEDIGATISRNNPHKRPARRQSNVRGRPSSLRNNYVKKDVKNNKVVTTALDTHETSLTPSNYSSHLINDESVVTNEEQSKAFSARHSKEEQNNIGDSTDGKFANNIQSPICSRNHPEIGTNEPESCPSSLRASKDCLSEVDDDYYNEDIMSTLSDVDEYSLAGSVKTNDNISTNNEDDSSVWINTGATKEDDDRVVHEVKKRHDVAKRIFSSGAKDNIGKSPLECLLDQSSQYTAYMLAQSLAPYDGDYPEDQPHRSSRKAGGAARRREREKDIEEMQLLQEADAELTGHQRFWTRLETQPSSITGGTLKPYQLEGLNWLIHLYESGLNGILADEMGLGKTLQSISLLAYLKEFRNIVGPHLILAPKSTLGNWHNEVKRFCPSMNAYKFHGTKDQRAEAKAKGLLNPGVFDIIITSYELCIKEQQLFKKFRFRYIVVDEAHRIKNEASKLSQIIRQFRTQFRLLLTGTPLQNNLRELWALLNFLFPEMFSSGEEFDRLFDLTGTSEEVKSLTSDEKTARNAEIVSRLHKILNPFLLRRVKSEVMVDLPPKKELLLYIPLSSLQRTLYIDLLSRNVDAMHDIQGGGRVRLLNLAMQLRKACNHPYLFEGYEDKTLDPFGEHIVFNSGKVLLLDRLLQRLISRGSRVVIFTQMTRMLDILEDYCRMRDFSYCRLDGSTLGDERERQLDEFNAPGSPHSVFLLSTRAGGLGINLATADTVILFDSDWNPQVDLQAMDRAHRIGQKKPVNVYRFIHQHTIEEKIIERASLKLRLDTAVIQQGRLIEQQKQLGKGELLRMIQFGADRIFKSKDAAEMTDEDVEAILSRGEQRCQELSTRLESHLKKSLLNFDTSFSTPSLYEFEGVDYEPQKDRQAWAEMGVSALEEERNAKRKVRIVQEQLEALQRQHLGFTVSGGGIPDKFRNKLLKLPRMEEWQFYQKDRINELHELEVQFANGLGDEPSFDEREEKQRLLSEGFAEWTRKDFLTFIKACETWGIGNLDQVTKDVGKHRREVERYSAVFLERYQGLTDANKWISKVRTGDTVNAKKKEIEEILAKRLCEEQFPWRRTFVRFPKSKSHFSDEEDMWLLNAVHALGYGSWDALQIAISRDPTWTFDWFFKSRSPQDIGRRTEFLIRQLQRENQEEAQQGNSTSTRSKAKVVHHISQRAHIALQNHHVSSNYSLYGNANEMYGSTIIPPTQTPKITPGTTKRPKVSATLTSSASSLLRTTAKQQQSLNSTVSPLSIKGGNKKQQSRNDEKSEVNDKSLTGDPISSSDVPNLIKGNNNNSGSSNMISGNNGDDTSMPDELENETRMSEVAVNNDELIKGKDWMNEKIEDKNNSDSDKRLKIVCYQFSEREDIKHSVVNHDIASTIEDNDWRDVKTDLLIEKCKEEDPEVQSPSATKSLNLIQHSPSPNDSSFMNANVNTTDNNINDNIIDQNETPTALPSLSSLSSFIPLKRKRLQSSTTDYTNEALVKNCKDNNVPRDAGNGSAGCTSSLENVDSRNDEPCLLSPLSRNNTDHGMSQSCNDATTTAVVNATPPLVVDSSSCSSTSATTSELPPFVVSCGSNIS